MDADPQDAREADPVASMLAVIDLSASDARTTEDIFTGVSQSMPLGRVYGGQVLAQSIVAASRTIPEERIVHSMHGYFLRPGDSAKGITFAVDRIHDGRSFSTRRTQAFQDGVPIFSMIASFQDEDPGLEHHTVMPEGLPAPDDLPDIESHLEGLHPMSKRLFTDRPVDLRHIPSPIYTSVEGERVPSQAVWMRVRRQIPDTPAIHRAALAYLSDPDDPGVDPACPRRIVGDPRPEGREPRSRDVVAPVRARGRVDAVRPGVAERSRRARARDGPHLRRGRHSPGERRSGDHGAGAGRRLISADARMRSARPRRATRRRAPRV